jgi:hypothetical protein
MGPDSPKGMKGRSLVAGIVRAERDRVSPVDPADWHPHIAKVRVGSILRGAVRLYRLEPARVAGASLAILLPPVLLGEAAHEWEAAASTSPFLLVAVLPATSSLLTLLGLVLLAGVMDELVGSAVRGTPQPSLAEAARALPLGRLVAADVVVAVLVSAAAALGAVPGVVLAALVGIVGPAVNVERLGPIRAVARSFRLTWPHVWIAIGVVAPALVVEGVAHAFLVRTWDALGLLGELLVEIPLIMSVGAMVALTEVVLAYALMARDPASPVAAMVASALATAPAPEGARPLS